MTASLFTDESERPDLSHSSAFVDATPEKVFDDLTWLAAQICCSPMALLNLVNDDRPWIKSKVGLPAGEAGRDFTLVNHTMARRELLVVTDAREEERFAKTPLVAGEMKIRFYAGMPLISSEGKPLGVLSVLDRLPRQLSPEQIYALEILARQITAQLEWRLKDRRDSQLPWLCEF
jgi:GAF domain-containing protein